MLWVSTDLFSELFYYAVAITRGIEAGTKVFHIYQHASCLLATSMAADHSI